MDVSIQPICEVRVPTFRRPTLLKRALLSLIDQTTAIGAVLPLTIAQKGPPNYRRRLNRYMQRWLVERFFVWIQWQRLILVRWEYHVQNFLGFVQLACLVVLFRRF